MKNLQMPHSYISVSEELRSFPAAGRWAMHWIFSSAICVWTIFFSGGLISLSFTFGPSTFNGKTVQHRGERLRYHRRPVPFSHEELSPVYLGSAAAPEEEKGLLPARNRFSEPSQQTPFASAKSCRCVFIFRSLVLRPVPAAAECSSCPCRIPARSRYDSVPATLPAHRPEWFLQSRRPASARHRCCPAGCTGSTPVPPTAPDAGHPWRSTHSGIVQRMRARFPEPARQKAANCVFQQSPALGQRAAFSS